jgi:hypothetical protein
VTFRDWFDPRHSVTELNGSDLSRMYTDEHGPHKSKIRVIPCHSVTGLIRVIP